MIYYGEIEKEETFKATVFRDFFPSSKYSYKPNIDNIDFVVAEAGTLKNNMGTESFTPRHGILGLYH